MSVNPASTGTDSTGADSGAARQQPDCGAGRALPLAGEKGFAVVLLLAASFFLYQSALLWADKPGFDGPAVIPLISSGAVTLLALITVIRNIFAKKPPVGAVVRRNAARQAVAYLLPANIVVAIASIIIYCILLRLGVSFYILTPVFLWGLMTFLSRGGYIKNLVWTAICMAFILLVFRLLFGVMLP